MHAAANAALRDTFLLSHSLFAQLRVITPHQDAALETQSVDASRERVWLPHTDTPALRSQGEKY